MSLKGPSVRHSTLGDNLQYCFRNKATGALTLWDARVVEHGFKSLVGLSKGRSVWWVPLPACNVRKQSKSQCLKQVGDKFLFCPGRQKIPKLSQLQSFWSPTIKQVLESFQILIHSSSQSPYRIHRSWEEGTNSKNPSSLPTPQVFLISLSLFLNFMGKGEFHVCYPGCLDWTHLAQSQVTVCKAPSNLLLTCS